MTGYLSAKTSLRHKICNPNLIMGGFSGKYRVTTLSNYRCKYDHTAYLTRRGWAYEHLRRNRYFQKAAYRSEQVVFARHWKGNIYILDMIKPQPEAETWGLIFFPNPDQTAAIADAFWSETAYPNHIRLFVTPSKPNETDEIYEASAKLNAIRQLTDVNGIEHLLVQGAGCAFQARCTGSSLRSVDPVKMSFQLTAPSRLQHKFNLIKAAQKIYVPNNMSRPTWTPGAERLRNGLITLDVLEAGLTTRHAAQIVYGSKRVKEEWFNGQWAMKDRIRSWRDKAIFLRDGGYRELLQKLP